MDEITRNKLVKATGDAAGALASASIGFVLFVMTLSITVLYYKIEMWAVVSVMIGIALTCIFVRLSLLLSNFKEHKPENVIKSVLKWSIAFAVLGILGGYFVAGSLNVPHPNEMCYEILNGVIEGHNEETIQDCFDYRDRIHLLLNFVLAGYAILMIFWLVAHIAYKMSRFDRP